MSDELKLADDDRPVWERIAELAEKLPQEMVDGLSQKHNEIASLIAQLSTVTAQRDASMNLLCRIAAAMTGQEEPSNGELDEIDFVNDIEQLKNQRDAAVEALKVADAWFTEQDDNDTHAQVVRAAIAAAVGTP